MGDRLADYRTKRDPAATPEPAASPDGNVAGPGDGPSRFVVQEHHATRLHWDLRMERDGALASWAVPNGIPDDPARNRKAVRTEDHPLEYLDFEGDIPAGNYGAGSMRIWDYGTYQAEKWRDGEVIATFSGQRLRGRYALIRTGKGADAGKDWLMHRMDPAVDPQAEEMPEALVPMLARTGPLPPGREHARWSFEIKWDGVRALVYSEPGRIRLESRNGRDITASYPELRALNRALSHHRAILDGEIVAFDAESDPPRPSFARLQQRMHLTAEAQVRRRARETPVVLMLFDLLWLDGHPLLELPYDERRSRLAELELNGTAWQTPAAHLGDGAALLAATAQQGLEGLVAKRRDAPYEPGRRTGAWIKVKNVHRQEVVIAGWLPGEGRRSKRLGALVVGVHDDEGGDLRYAGRVGSGFSERTLDDLGRRLAELGGAPDPFAGAGPRGAIWVRPELLAEVEFTQWTQDGLLRHPSFKGLRDDKAADGVVREDVGGGDDDEVVRGDVDGSDARELTIAGPPARTVRVSNWSKILWPQTGFTKGDLVDYYCRIAPTLLPHLEGRPLTLKRYPNGVDGAFFYEKNSPGHRPEWVATAPVRMGSKTIDFTLVGDTATLAWLANLADIELHTSLARAPDVRRPTMLVFDLDPGAPADIVACCEVALVLRGLFDGLGLITLAKTSGSKGLQIYLPLNRPEITYEQTKPLAQAVADLLEQRMPELVVARQAKRLRRGKVLVDWSQNDEAKTTVNVYSVRARERPTVSTPVSWEEVAACREAGNPSLLSFETTDVLKRVDELGDLFAPALSTVQALPAV